MVGQTRGLYLCPLVSLSHKVAPHGQLRKIQRITHHGCPNQSTYHRCPHHIGLPHMGRTEPNNPKWTPNGPNMPRKSSQTIRDHFWAKLFRTIFGPKSGDKGGPVGWAAGRRAPPPSAARGGVLGVRLTRSEGWKSPKVGGGTQE